MKPILFLIAAFCLIVPIALQAQLYKGTFQKANFQCPVNGASEGYLTTTEGKRIEIICYVELVDGQTVRATEASWSTKKCNGNTYKVYVINNIAWEFTSKGSNNQEPEPIVTPEVTPATTILETGSNVSINEAEIALAFHNKARADVGVAPLVWSTELSNYAQEWANYLAKKNCGFYHRSGNLKPKNYGENIFGGSGREYTALDASQGWYSEINQYINEPINATNWTVTGHYSQMIWHNTTQLGIGIAQCPSGSYIIVANYNPPGNFMGQKAY